MAEQSSTPYVDALLEYAGRDPGRLHVPGHKGGPGADPALVELVGDTALHHDIPSLIQGIDVVAEATDQEPPPFEQAQRLAARAWGARRTWFLINGASQGNHAACLALAHAGERVVVQRNVHSSVIDGAVVAGLRPAFVSPELDPELGVAHCLTPESLAGALDATPGAVGAIVVSPTYFGACADLEGMAEAAHARGLPLVVDEAWGAHLRFHPDLPPDALAAGADLVISSTHKIVGSLTQAAMLHLGAGDRIEAAVVDRCVSLVESTSPSGLLCGSLDAARRLAATRGEDLLSETIAALHAARDAIREVPGLDVLDERMVGRAGVAGWDPLRLSIDVRGTGSTGYRLADIARSEDDINFELFAENVAVGVFGMGAPARPLVERLVAALRRTVERIGADPPAEQPEFAPPPPWGELVMTPREAFLGPQEVVPFDGAEGRVAAESLAAYPPGIPNVLPGERLTRETLDYVAESVAHGGSVRGAADRELRTLRVAAGR
ncbi:MAG TPA: amino acid decarboxylase [Solirubrobacterales bacterium]|nr:amino acid decarboxylase [Solirubrobacterales bacterium]